MTAVCDEFRPAAGAAHPWCDTCGWRRDLHSPDAVCHLCGRGFDPETAHDLHEEDCTRAGGVCPGCGTGRSR